MAAIDQIRREDMIEIGIELAGDSASQKCPTAARRPPEQNSASTLDAAGAGQANVPDWGNRPEMDLPLGML